MKMDITIMVIMIFLTSDIRQEWLTPKYFAIEPHRYIISKKNIIFNNSIFNSIKKENLKIKTLTTRINYTLTYIITRLMTMDMKIYLIHSKIFMIQLNC